LDAFLAELIADKYIVINPKITEIIIGMIEMLYTIPSTLASKYSPNIKLTIFIKTRSANNPHNIPLGTPDSSEEELLQILHFF